MPFEDPQVLREGHRGLRGLGLARRLWQGETHTANCRNRGGFPFTFSSII